VLRPVLFQFAPRPLAFTPHPLRLLVGGVEVCRSAASSQCQYSSSQTLDAAPVVFEKFISLSANHGPGRLLAFFLCRLILLASGGLLATVLIFFTDQAHRDAFGI